MLVDSRWKYHQCCLGAFRQLESLLSKTNKAVLRSGAQSLCLKRQQMLQFSLCTSKTN